MSNKILTLDNLYQFFVEQNKAFNFNSKESGNPIVVSIPGNFEVESEDMPGMLKTKLKVCHIDTNRNGSHISKENMEKAMPTLKYRPILAHIHQLNDGTYDFYAHNMEIVEDENGEEQVNYIEKQVGCFTADEPYLEYDENMDKTYVMAYAVIPEEYTQAADIIRRKQGTKVSCELVINELAYNAAEKYLDLTDFYFGGTTLLGCDEQGNEIGEGMLGSRLDIADFCHKEPVYNNYKDKLIEVLDKLNVTLSTFSNNTNQEGGGSTMNKFEQLLEQYGKTQEDITFDVEGLSDEELEVKFKEAFEESEEPEVEEQPQAEEKFTKVFSVEVSHEDVKFALYNLISQYDEADNDWYSIRNVYDNYFYMQGWINGKIYKQNYSINEANVSLEGERQEMFEIIVSESEKIAIDQMRNNYSALEAQYNELKAFKDEYDAAKIKSQKDEIFGKEEYECLKETEGFKQLVEDADKYSVEEISVKADLLFAAYIKSTGEFSMKKTEVKPIAMTFGVTTVDESNKKPYGNLFDD